MKEYRIVCDRRTVDSHGKETIQNNVAPLLYTYCLPHHTIYNTRKEVNKALKTKIEMAKAFDEITQKKLSNREPDAIGYWQSNFRIQSRTITEWKEG